MQGLDEGRPSLIIGDVILVQHSSDTTGTWFEGVVHEITGISIFVKFNKKFTALKGHKVNVRFKLNRVPDRRMHQAVTSTITRPEVLFPTTNMIRDLRRPTPAEIDSLGVVDRNLSQNPEQLETIAAIATRPLGSVPFVVFGPCVIC